MLAAAQRTAGGVFLTFPEDLRPLSAIDYIMYCHSRYVPTSEVGGAEKRLSSPEKRLTAPVKYAILPSALMLVWLSWQSSSLVMSRSPVRIRPQAPKKQHPKGCCFFIELVRSRSLSPLAGEIRPQAPTPCRHRAASFLFALAVYVSTLFFRGTFEVQTALCAAAHTSETATRYIAHEMPISGHNCRYMRNYRDGISAKRNISSREHHFLSNAVAGCRTKMLVFDKLPLHFLSVCGIFDSVKAVRGVYMGNCVPLKLC